MTKYKNILNIFLACLTIQQASPRDVIKSLKTGNLALPSSQQPTPLFTMGQNIVDKGCLQLFGLLDQNKGKHKNSVEIVPGTLYGITDDLSIFIEAPTNIYHYPKDGIHPGIQDCITQLEYVVYKKERLNSVDSATILGNIIFPTRTLNESSFTTGASSPSVLLGATLSRMATDWYYFTSTGVIVSVSNKGTKAGNQYLFQWGFGKNIPTLPKFIATWMIEFNGIFNQKDTIQDSRDSNSGGQIFYLGPTLWLAWKKLVIQSGIALPIYQHLNGNQRKNTYFAALNIGVTI